jgi:hypothetical protein
MRLPPFLLAVLAAVLAGGCEDLELACEFDPHDWYDNPTYTLWQGVEGRFDFDPVGDEIRRRNGSYNLTNGNLHWVDVYEEGHYLTTISTTGYGTIYDNGDLDLLFRRNSHDVLNAVWADLHRVKRTGCEGTTTVTDFEPDLTVDDDPPEGAETVLWSTEIVSDDEVRGHQEGVRDTTGGDMTYVVDTTSTREVKSHVTVEMGEGAYLLDETWQYDGTGVGTFAQYGEPFGDDVDTVGEHEYHFDGSWLSTYDMLEAGTDDVVARVSLLWLYNGSATGTYTWWDEGTEVVCTVVVERDLDCEMDCGTYGIFDC